LAAVEAPPAAGAPAPVEETAGAAEGSFTFEETSDGDGAPSRVEALAAAVAGVPSFTLEGIPGVGLAGTSLDAPGRAVPRRRKYAPPAALRARIAAIASFVFRVGSAPFGGTEAGAASGGAPKSFETTVRSCEPASGAVGGTACGTVAAALGTPSASPRARTKAPQVG
jgi:hypothetical protein